MCSLLLGHKSDDRNKAVRKIVAERRDRDWCLFLDRDGVINRQIVGDYVRHWSDFEWLAEAQSALRTLRDWAPRLVVVTNQQGVGKGLMGLDDVAAIHQQLNAAIAAGRPGIDAFLVCPHLESEACACRKPKTGLVLDWLRGHPENDPSLSIMVGDSRSDMELAHNVGISTGGCASVHIGREPQGIAADASFDLLGDFALAVTRAREELGW